MFRALWQQNHANMQIYNDAILFNLIFNEKSSRRYYTATTTHRKYSKKFQKFIILSSFPLEVKVEAAATEDANKNLNFPLLPPPSTSPHSRGKCEVPLPPPTLLRPPLPFLHPALMGKVPVSVYESLAAAASWRPR